MPRYAIEVVGRVGCGCSARVDFELGDGTEPAPGDVAAVLASALDPDVSDILEFLMDHRHEHGGYEKVIVVACVKVRP